MPDRIDYEISSNWDMSFTDWDDLQTVSNTDVLSQNFVLLASEYTSQLVGEQVNATRLSRHRRTLESEFRERESVSYFSIENVEVFDNRLEYRIIIGSDEYTMPVYTE